MNQICSSEVLPPEKDMKYKPRFVSVHEGQGGGFIEQETKKKGRKKGRKKTKVAKIKHTVMAIFVNLLLHTSTNLMTMC